MFSNTDTHSGPYLCNGATVEFPITFPFLAETDIIVYLIAPDATFISLALTADYTVTGDNSGDDIPNYLINTKITTLTAYASGYKIVICRNIPLDQPIDIQNQSTFYPPTLETEYDRIVMQIQMLYDMLTRAALANPGAIASGDEPVVVATAVMDYVVGKTFIGDAQDGLIVFGAHTVAAAGMITHAELEAFAGAPTGQALIGKVYINGVLNSQSLTLPNGSTYARVALGAPITVAAGDKIEWAFSQVGTTKPGNYVTVTLRVKGS